MVLYKMNHLSQPPLTGSPELNLNLNSYFVAILTSSAMPKSDVGTVQYTHRRLLTHLSYPGRNAASLQAWQGDSESHICGKRKRGGCSPSYTCVQLLP